VFGFTLQLFDVQERTPRYPLGGRMAGLQGFLKYNGCSFRGLNSDPPPPHNVTISTDIFPIMCVWVYIYIYIYIYILCIVTIIHIVGACAEV